MAVPWTFDHEVEHLDEEKAIEVSKEVLWD
jgi:hypothetical protein